MFIQYIETEVDGDNFLTNHPTHTDNIVIKTYKDTKLTSLTFNLTEITTEEFGRTRLAREWVKNGSNQIAVMYQPISNIYYLAHSNGSEHELLCNLPRCLTSLINEGNSLEVYNSSITNIIIHGSMFLELMVTIEFVS